MPTLRSRTFLEEYARDSFENLLFSICRFYEVTQKYPTKVTVIGLSVKKRRFTELHRAALRYPVDRFSYIGSGLTENKMKGTKPTASTSNRTSFSSDEIPEGEFKNAYEPFSHDLYGCSDPLDIKRRSRNPFMRTNGLLGYQESCPALKPLMRFCSTDGSVFAGHLPWDNRTDLEVE